MDRLTISVAAVLGIVTLELGWADVPAERAAVHGQRIGNGLYCDDGYYNDGAHCVGLPRVANGGYHGSTVYCNDGYSSDGGRCIKLPEVENGSYLGTTPYCHDGYYRDRVRCIKLPEVLHGSYLGIALYCNDGYYNDGVRCDPLPGIVNGAFVGDVRVCNDGFENIDGLCITSSGSGDVWRRIDAASLARSRNAPAPAGPYDVFVEESSSILQEQSSGSKFDSTSGNSFRWYRTPDGSTTVNGMNFNTRSSWRTTIQRDGSMRGLGKNSYLWRYSSSLGLYLNSSTGKLCAGKGAARNCF